LVDLEMTGLDPERHRVVQICVQRVIGGHPAGRLSSFVRLEPAAAVGGAAIHGITAEHLVDAPPFALLAKRTLELLDGAVLVAHAARHDVAFLGAELSRLGRRWDCPHFLDTLALTRRAFGFSSHRLVALAERFGIEHGRLHRADSDVEVLAGVLRRLVERLQPDCPRTLWQLQHRRRAVRPDVLRAAEHAAAHGQPVRILYRPSSGPPRSLPFVVRKLCRDLDPPLVLGYLHPSRGRRELRADRILTILTIEQAGDDD